MPTQNYSKAFIKKLKAITAKRAKTVIDHILKHGSISTEDLKEKYGYDHPPRALQDVKDRGIPLIKFSVTASNGRKIAAYRFPENADESDIVLRGRRAFPKTLKNGLLALQSSRCAICNLKLRPNVLQIDHKVPYAVLPDSADSELDPDDFQLLCASCNRAKSWSCEHCPNSQTTKNVATCQSCYWGNPTTYNHVATMNVRRVDLTWQGDSVADYDRLDNKATAKGEPLPEFVKRILKHLANE